jgi:hypothetical protein
VFNKWGCVCKKDNEKVFPNNSKKVFFQGYKSLGSLKLIDPKSDDFLRENK